MNYEFIGGYLDEQVDHVEQDEQDEQNTEYIGGYLDDEGISGGNIQMSSSLFKWVAIGLLVVFIIWLGFKIYDQFRIAGEDKNQRLTRIHFNNIRGEDFDEEAKQVLQYGEAIEEPRAIDHYRVGAVYLLNARDPVRAHTHFRDALDQIIHGLVDTREAPFIIDRIQDFNNHFVDFVDIDDLPIQQAMMIQFENQANQLKQVSKVKKEIQKDDPEFIQKTLLSRRDWHLDSQNVHDTAVYTELKDQLHDVMESNKKIKNAHLHDYNEAINWLRVKYKNDSDKLKKLNSVVSFINFNYPVEFAGCNEQDIITAIWQRTFDPANERNAKEMREALGDAILDCVERDHVVCLTGRSSKVWQALARLDKNEELGVLKTKEAVRNEIYERSAKIVDDFVGENGSTSLLLKEAYNRSDETEQVKELAECIKSQIDALKLEYQGRLDDQNLHAIVEECKAVV